MGKRAGGTIMKQIIFPRAPYDMERVMLKLAKDPHFHLDMESSILSFPVRVQYHQEEKEWKKALCILHNKGTVEKPSILMQVEGVGFLEAEEEDWLLAHLKSRFQWESDALSRFYEGLTPHPKLSQFVQHYRGVPLLLEDNTYESLIKTIIHQQINLNFAHQLVYSLSVEYGEKLTYQGKDYFLFPTASVLAHIEVQELRNRKFSQRKAEYIIGLAQKIVNLEIDLTSLEEKSNEEVIDYLTKVRGVGRWTVECLLLYCLGRHNLFPAADIGIQKAIQHIEQLEKKPTQEECREWINPFEEWGSYIAIYLWESLGNNTLKIK
jgi:DNA-3-methyladenine glycosylase II